MKKAQLFRKARLLAIPAVLAAGMIGAAQVGVSQKGCKLDPSKCYKLTYHPT